MKIGDLLRVWYDLGINLLNVNEIKSISPDSLPSLLKITRSKNIPDFIEKYKRCFNPPTNKTEKSDNNETEINIYDLVVIAGMCGLTNYKDCAVWELLAFVKGNNKAKWATTSAVLAMINNAHCTKQKDLKTPDDFNPTISEKEKAEKRAKNAVPLERVFGNE